MLIAEVPNRSPAFLMWLDVAASRAAHSHILQAHVGRSTDAHDARPAGCQQSGAQRWSAPTWARRAGTTARSCGAPWWTTCCAAPRSARAWGCRPWSLFWLRCGRTWRRAHRSPAGWSSSQCAAQALAAPSRRGGGGACRQRRPVRRCRGGRAWRRRAQNSPAGWTCWAGAPWSCPRCGRTRALPAGAAPLRPCGRPVQSGPGGTLLSGGPDAMMGHAIRRVAAGTP